MFNISTYCWNRCLFVWESLKRISKIQHNGIDYIIDYAISLNHTFECPYFQIGFSMRHRCRSQPRSSATDSRCCFLDWNIYSSYLALAFVFVCLSSEMRLQQKVFNPIQKLVFLVLSYYKFFFVFSCYDFFKCFVHQTNCCYSEWWFTIFVGANTILYRLAGSIRWEKWPLVLVLNHIREANKSKLNTQAITLIPKHFNFALEARNQNPAKKRFNLLRKFSNFFLLSSTLIAVLILGVFLSFF